MAQIEALNTFWLDGAPTDNLRFFPAQIDVAPLSPIYLGEAPGTLFWEQIEFRNSATEPYKNNSEVGNDDPFMVFVLFNCSHTNRHKFTENGTIGITRLQRTCTSSTCYY